MSAPAILCHTWPPAKTPMSVVRALERMMKTYWKELVLIGLHVHVGGGCTKTVQKTVQDDSVNDRFCPLCIDLLTM